jgi:hypothetical protein
MILFADGDEPRDSRNTALARLAPASTTPPVASTASSGFVLSPTVATAGITLITVVTLEAFAVIRRNKRASPSDTSSLSTSSSGVKLSDFAMPMHTSTVMTGDGYAYQSLQAIATSYDTQMYW